MYKIGFYLLFLLSCSQLALAESNRGVEEVLVNDWTQNQQATQHALVVGIDKYKEVRNLDGAVNDAKLLSSALRKAGVDLPKSRILLNEQATRVAFVQAWRNMVREAKPGDTLILTFAGHGAQEDDMPPLGEPDKKDESFVFYDYQIDKQNRSNPQGRITDDELFGLFEQASDYKILVIADSCHSSGMVRAINQKPTGKSRSIGYRQLQRLAPPAYPVLPKSREGKPLPYVTYLTAVEHDSLEVMETRLNDKAHGALSWFFAQAISGKEADGNKNGRLERDELDRFLTEKIKIQTNYTQTPKILPKSDKVSVFDLRTQKKGFVVVKPKTSTIAIVVKNGRVPRGLKHIRLVKPNQSFDLLFVIKGRHTEVFNNTSDKLTTISSSSKQEWQRLINKQRILKTLATKFSMRLAPIKIKLREGNGLHKKGSYLHFSIGSSKEG